MSVPAEIREFILRNIDSIADMEALLLVSRETSRRWESATLARRLYISGQEAGQVLSRLHARGLLTFMDGTYAFDPKADPEELVAKIAAIYAEQLIPITNLIHSKALSRVQQFADAFKLKKDD